MIFPLRREDGHQLHKVSRSMPLFERLWPCGHSLATRTRSIVTLVRRGIPTFWGALAAVAMLSGPASAGPDRLVEACQAAVGVHAKHLALRFSETESNGYEVHLSFAFDNGGRDHAIKARCVFHQAASATAPPSLVDLEAMGRMTAARFLVSHHAVWRYFRGEAEPVAEAVPERTEPPAEPIKDGERRRKLAAR